MGAVAGAEEATPETLVGNGDAAQVGANGDDDGVVALGGEAGLIGLGVLELSHGALVHLLHLALGAVVDVDGLTTPDDGLAGLLVEGTNLSLNVHLGNHRHTGLADVPEGEEGVAEHVDHEAEHEAVEGVVEDAGLVDLVGGELRLKDVLAEELLVPNVGVELLEGHDILDAALAGALRVGVEDNLLSGVDLSELGVGVLGVATVLLLHLGGDRGLHELVGPALDGLVLSRERRGHLELLEDQGDGGGGSAAEHGCLYY